MITLEIADKLKAQFASRLKKHRESRQLSQSEFAKLLGLSLATYNRYEKQNAQPSISLLVRMADVLGITIDKLVGYDNNNLLSDIEETYLKLDQLGIAHDKSDFGENIVFIEKEIYTLNDTQLMDLVEIVDDYTAKATTNVYRDIFISEFKRDYHLMRSSTYPGNVNKEN